MAPSGLTIGLHGQGSDADTVAVRSIPNGVTRGTARSGRPSGIALQQRPQVKNYRRSSVRRRHWGRSPPGRYRCYHLDMLGKRGVLLGHGDPPARMNHCHYQSRPIHLTEGSQPQRSRLLRRKRRNQANSSGSIASAVLAMAILSVCPSVTRRYCVKTTHRTVQFALSDSKMCLVL